VTLTFAGLAFQTVPSCGRESWTQTLPIDAAPTTDVQHASTASTAARFLEEPNTMDWVLDANKAMGLAECLLSASHINGSTLLLFCCFVVPDHAVFFFLVVLVLVLFFLPSPFLSLILVNCFKSRLDKYWRDWTYTAASFAVHQRLSSSSFLLSSFFLVSSPCFFIVLLLLSLLLRVCALYCYLAIRL